MLEEHADPPRLGLDPRARPRDGAPADLHPARVGHLEARHEAQQRRLARAAGPEHGGDRSGRHGERHVVDGGSDPNRLAIAVDLHGHGFGGGLPDR